MSFGSLTFLAPLALLGLLTLPLIWWLLRITPPKPLQQIFPPLRILQDVAVEEETPNSTPLWLLIFRLLMVTLIAFALAQPLLTQPEGSRENRDIVLLIDDGWEAAPNWSKIMTEAETYINQAQRDGVKVGFLSMTNDDQEDLYVANASDALRYVKSQNPRPRNSSLGVKASYLDLLSDYIGEEDATSLKNSELIWLSSGLTSERAGVDELKAQLEKFASYKVITPPSNLLPLIPGKLEETVDGFRMEWHRADGNGLRSTDVTAHDNNGRIIARNNIIFSPGQTMAETKIELPTELRSKILAIRVDDSVSAGSVKLLDDSWGRPLIGVLTENKDNPSPLLSEPFYAETALRPYADVFRGSLEELLPLAPSILVMPDAARDDSPEISEFVENGGLLIRFAGPKLAQRPDEYLPVRLRSGGRALGGALTWEEPQNFSEFSPDSPFFGLSIPEDIEVKQQVMAEPGAETDSRTWARLEDGSPVVTAKDQGFGRIVLFHVTADPEWSNIPVSGLYVDMLRRLLSLAKSSSSKGASGESTSDWAPERVLNGFGRLKSPDLYDKPVPFDQIDSSKDFDIHPPGLYRQGPRRKALNVNADPATYASLASIGNLTLEQYGKTRDNNLGGILLWIGLLMLALDALLAIYASGRTRILGDRLTLTRKDSAAIVAVLLLTAPLASDSHAQDDTHFKDALELHFAYVETGDPRVDTTSENAMEGLAEILTRRTTIEPAGVRGVDPATDSLIFYPFLYWPVERDAPALTDEAIASLNEYMASGGTIVFDTRDSGDDFLSVGDPHPGLKRITENLDIPPLNEVPENHVLNKSYFLIDLYPGRWANGQVWVDKNQSGAARDGVSSVIIGSNDWAAAWARENDTYYIDIERDIPKQREMALRFGVNLAMYTLAGNYKADQVHAKALIERRGVQEREPENLGPDDESEE